MKEINAYKVRSLKEKIIGQIGKDKPVPIVLHTRFGIHTFLVKFPLDILILDNKNEVKKLKKKLKPNRIFFWNPKYSKVVELSHGTIDEKGIRVGDVVRTIRP